MLWNVNMLARAFTKWNMACDEKACYIDEAFTFQWITDSMVTSEIVQVSACLVCFEMTMLSRVMWCLFSERTLVTVSWASKKKQIAVSHCITEADVISPDPQLRIGVLTALS